MDRTISKSRCHLINRHREDVLYPIRNIKAIIRFPKKKTEASLRRIISKVEMGATRIQRKKYGVPNCFY